MVSLQILTQNWSAWLREWGWGDSVWLSRLCPNRHGHSILDSWITHSGGSQGPYWEDTQAALREPHLGRILGLPPTTSNKSPALSVSHLGTGPSALPKPSSDWPLGCSLMRTSTGIIKISCFLNPDPQKLQEIINVYCLKSLRFGIICYAIVDNVYRTQYWVTLTPLALVSSRVWPKCKKWSQRLFSSEFTLLWPRFPPSVPPALSGQPHESPGLQLTLCSYNTISSLCPFKPRRAIRSWFP